jgi:hypothetical protein|tara:strand:- start:340 stop:1542 length:1203 start_codon:yes stop_codon:yes gene_type:complete
MDSIEKLDYDYLYNNKSDTIINTLHDNIEKADNYVTKKKKGSCFNYTITKINTVSQIPRPTMYDSHFFPDKIKKYIDENSTYTLQFTCTIKKRVINVHFVIFEYTTQDVLFILNRYIQMIYMWMYMLDSFSVKKCSKILDLYIYLTPFKKELPDNQLVTLDSEHVNTGYTTGCREQTEIVLYRKEEWFKVFIHETFHNFGLDFSDMNLSSINKCIREIFNVNIEYNLYESYCEVWARIMNTMIYSYFSLPNKHRSNPETFRNTFKENMKIEAYHSLYQSLKILTFMDLNFKLITEKSKDNIEICNHLYREKTSVFSYYIITSLLMNNYINFLGWCVKHNNILLQFRKTPGNLDKYIEFIKESCKNPHIKKNIKKLEKIIGKTDNISKNLKMTIIEIPNII